MTEVKMYNVNSVTTITLRLALSVLVFCKTDKYVVNSVIPDQKHRNITESTHIATMAHISPITVAISEVINIAKLCTIILFMCISRYE